MELTVNELWESSIQWAGKTPTNKLIKFIPKSLKVYNYDVESANFKEKSADNNCEDISAPLLLPTNFVSKFLI